MKTCLALKSHQRSVLACGKWALWVVLCLCSPYPRVTWLFQVLHKIICLNSRPHDCICSLLLKTATSKLTSLPGPLLLKTVFQRSLSLQDHLEHDCLRNRQPKSDAKIRCLIFKSSLIVSEQVWTCLNMSEHVWSYIRSCLIILIESSTLSTTTPQQQSKL
jgi:hypothetical protein